MECPKCSYVRQPGDQSPDTECPQCGVIYAKANPKKSLLEARLDYIRKTGRLDGLSADDIQSLLATVRLSTTHSIGEDKTIRSIGVVFGEHAYAFGGIEEVVGGFFRDVVGSGTSTAMSSKLHLSRSAALERLKLAALLAGGNAVVGIKVDIEEFSGANGRGVLVIAASGTAVVT